LKRAAPNTIVERPSWMLSVLANSPVNPGMRVQPEPGLIVARFRPQPDYNIIGRHADYYASVLHIAPTRSTGPGGSCESLSSRCLFT